MMESEELKLNIDVNREIIKDVCKLDECGFANPEVFQKGYSPYTLAVYAILASHNGKLRAEELMKVYSPGYDGYSETEADCMYALWDLYKGGFVELNTLTDEGVKIISEQLRLDKLGQKNNG